MIELSTDEQLVLDIIKKYDGIGISEIMLKTTFTWSDTYAIILKLSYHDMITFKKDGKYGIAGGVNNGNN